MKGVQYVLAIFFLLTCSSSAGAHGGALDQFGCHHNRKLGGYHCHRGIFAGQTFALQTEMLMKLKEQEKNKESEEKICIKEEGTGRIICGRRIP